MSKESGKEESLPFNPAEDFVQVSRRVEAFSEYYYYSEQQVGIDNRTKMYLFNHLLGHIHGETVLEFGYVDGVFTDMLLDRGHRVVIVEGATSHISRAQEKYRQNDRVSIVQGLFETYSTAEQFDTVIAGDMIQFIEDPVVFLKRSATMIAHGGKLIVTTPNNRSLHRRIGAVLNGGNPCEITAHERQTGTVRLYDAYSLREILTKSSLDVKILRGCFLKPLSSKQMENWDTRLLDALDSVAEDCGDMAWFLYAVCMQGREDECI